MPPLKAIVAAARERWDELYGRLNATQQLRVSRLTVREQLALLLALQPSLKLLTETPTAEEARNTACVFSESRSQFREDLLMLPMLLHVADNKPGTFVELGAFDGVDSSNSIMLERCFGWTGVEHPSSPPHSQRC